MAHVTIHFYSARTVARCQAPAKFPGDVREGVEGVEGIEDEKPPMPIGYGAASGGGNAAFERRGGGARR